MTVLAKRGAYSERPPCLTKLALMFPRSRYIPARPASPSRAQLLLVSTMFGSAVALSVLGCASSGKTAGQSTQRVGQTAGTGSGQPSSASVREITVERRCFRCTDQYRLTFRRDGTATMTTFALVDRRSTGTVTPEDFNGLTTLLQQEGFFDLAEVYRDPELVDGAFVTTTVIADGFMKSVLNSNQAGPPKLVAVEEAIKAVGKKVVWTDANR
jgi:hypothetical protein